MNRLLVEQVLLFGATCSAAGTPAAPSAALDLLLMFVVVEDAGGDEWIYYNAPE